MNESESDTTTRLTVQQCMELAMKASMAQLLVNCNLNDKSMQSSNKCSLCPVNVLF